MVFLRLGYIMSYNIYFSVWELIGVVKREIFWVCAYEWANLDCFDNCVGKGNFSKKREGNLLSL